jgi:hypothetical protein
MFRPGLAIVLATLAAPAGAEIYKWSDAQGKVHYGDQAPSSSIPIPFNPQTSKDAEARAMEARRQAADQAARVRLEQEKAREAANRQRDASEAEARRKAENCQRARSNLETLQRAYGRITKVDAQGRTQVLDAAARQAEMERAMRYIAENCAN